MIHFKNVTIIGVGLIGGSLARALKAKGLAGSITGAGRSSATLEQARALGVIDRAATDAAAAIGDADLVVLATPVGTFEKIVREIGPRLKRGAVLTDVGSVKGALIGSIEAALAPGAHYVPAHPIAGREKSGVAESTASLFEGRRCILTPTAKTDPAALAAVRELWTAVGAEVDIMDSDLHDSVFAAVSHLPHIAAFAMMSAVSKLKTDTEDYIAFSGAGFRDFTRIAASSPEMWRDICLMNRTNLMPMIDRYLSSLNSFKQAIGAGDAEQLEQQLKAASDARKRLG